MVDKIVYSSDVNIEDHANLVVFKNEDGDIQAIFIERLEDSGEVMVYGVELFSKPSDSWVTGEGLDNMNQSTGADYQYDEELDQFQQYRFTEDICWYYGAITLDSTPDVYEDQESFEEWLNSMELIQS